jgi:hypothetical protein
MLITRAYRAVSCPVVLVAEMHHLSTLRRFGAEVAGCAVNVLCTIDGTIVLLWHTSVAPQNTNVVWKFCFYVR